MLKASLFCSGRLPAIVALLLAASSFGFTQDSTSEDRRPAAKPSPSPAPQVRKANPSPERDEAMKKGQQLLFKQHDPKTAVDEFKRATKLDPWYGQAYMLLGLAEMQLRQWGDAQFAFEEASKVEPGNAKAYLGVGSALNEQHKYADAQKALEQALDLEPDSAEAQYELGRTLASTGKWDQAEPHVQRAIALNPNYAGPHALMGNIYVQKEQPEAALHELEEFLRLDPQSSMAPQVKDMIVQIKKTMEE
jgi:tetratricopeptide (TPR) repeat protein